jgi:hypothetical protein
MIHLQISQDGKLTGIIIIQEIDLEGQLSLQKYEIYSIDHICKIYFSL